MASGEGQERRLRIAGASSAAILVAVFAAGMASAGSSGALQVLAAAIGFGVASRCSVELPGRRNISVDLQEVAVVASALLLPFGHVAAAAAAGNVVATVGKRRRPAKVAVSAATGLGGALSGSAVVSALAPPLPDPRWVLASFAGGIAVAVSSGVLAHGLPWLVEGHPPSQHPAADVARSVPVGVTCAAFGAVVATAVTAGLWVWPLVAVAGGGVSAMFVLMGRSLRSARWSLTLMHLRALVDSSDNRAEILDRARTVVAGIFDGYVTQISGTPVPGASHEVPIDDDLRVAVTRVAHPFPLGPRALAYLDEVVATLSGGLRALDERQLLARDATTDPLTGLANRRVLEDLGGDRRRFGVVLFDVNNLKALNDTLGHHAGDDVLRWIARRTEETVRDGDLVARFGGDEFVVVSAEPANIDALVERLRSSLRAPPAPAELHVGVSFGSAVSEHDGSTLAEVLAAADARMYQDKQSVERPHRHAEG